MKREKKSSHQIGTKYLEISENHRFFMKLNSQKMKYENSRKQCENLMKAVPPSFPSLLLKKL